MSTSTGKGEGRASATADTPEAEAIREDIAQTRQQLGENVEELTRRADVKARAKEQAAQAKARAMEQAAHARERAMQQAAHARERAMQQATHARERVRNNAQVAAVRAKDTTRQAAIVAQPSPAPGSGADGGGRPSTAGLSIVMAPARAGAITRPKYGSRSNGITDNVTTLSWLTPCHADHGGMSCGMTSHHSFSNTSAAVSRSRWRRPRTPTRRSSTSPCAAAGPGD